MSDHDSLGQKFIDTYNHMLACVHAAFDETKPGLEARLEQAKEKASELEELSREELATIAGYLKRDIEDAGNWLGENGEELKDWLRFDTGLVESRILDAFTSLADQTRLELQALEYQADLSGEWKSGEVVGIGTLQCKHCGEQLHFHDTGHIPPCPKCHGSLFQRVSHAAD